MLLRKPTKTGCSLILNALDKFRRFVGPIYYVLAVPVWFMGICGLSALLTFVLSIFMTPPDKIFFVFVLMGFGVMTLWIFRGLYRDVLKPFFQPNPVIQAALTQRGFTVRTLLTQDIYTRKNLQIKITKGKSQHSFEITGPLQQRGQFSVGYPPLLYGGPYPAQGWVSRDFESKPGIKLAIKSPPEQSMPSDTGWLPLWNYLARHRATLFQIHEHRGYLRQGAFRHIEDLEEAMEIFEAL